MHNKQNNIDELFSEKLNDFGPIPPATVWEKIEKSLERNRKARVWLWIYRSGIAASLIVAFGTGWYFASHKADIALHSSRLANTEIHYSETNPPNEANSANGTQTTQSQNKLEWNTSETLASRREQAVIKTQNQGTEKEERLDQNTLLTRQAILIQKLPSRRIMAKQVQTFESNLSLNKLENFSLSEEDQAIIASNMEQIQTNSVSKEAIAQKWSIGAQLSPTQQFDEMPSFSNGYYEESPPLAESDVPNITSEYDVNLSGGFTVQYQATNKLSLQSGVNYNTISQNSDGVPIAFAGHNWISSRNDYTYQEGAYTSNKASSNNANINTSLGVANLTLPAGTDVLNTKRFETSYTEWAQNYRFSQNTGYIEIPFIARYQLLGKSLGLHLLGGINTNILVSNRAILINQQEILAKGKVEDLNALSFSTSMGLGINYTLLEKLQFSLEPTLKMMLNDLNKNSNIEAKPYTIGIYTGINYRF